MSARVVDAFGNRITRGAPVVYGRGRHALSAAIVVTANPLRVRILDYRGRPCTARLWKSSHVMVVPRLLPAHRELRRADGRNGDRER